MKSIFLSFICFAVYIINAQKGSYYTIAKSGLNLRASANTSANIITTIGYGEMVQMISGYVEEVQIDGMKGFWVKVQYKNQTGFLVDIFLSPIPPPKTGTQNLTDYFNQVSTILSKTATIDNQIDPTMMDTEFNAITKTLYKNGLEIHQISQYESGGTYYFFPLWKKESVFTILKQFEEFKILNTLKIKFPTQNQTYKDGETEADVTVSDGKITIEYVEGAGHTISILELDGQILLKVFSWV